MVGLAEEVSSSMKKVIKSPCVIVYNVISFMQQWRVLLSTEDQKLLLRVVKMFKTKMGISGQGP
jgi:hypothetical protein